MSSDERGDEKGLVGVERLGTIIRKYYVRKIYGDNRVMLLCLHIEIRFETLLLETVWLP